MAGYVIAMDIDGVLADWSHRLPMIQPPIGMVADWHSFYEAMPHDRTLPGAVIWNLLANQAAMIQKAVNEQGLELDYPVLDCLTCRPDKMRAVTLDWFERNGLMLPRAMHMRSDDDNRPHHVIKTEMYRKHYEGKEDVLAVVDDNAETIAAFRALGIPACHYG